MAELKIYGIRHHGPGSAKALLAALHRDQPDHLAIEMPADLQNSLVYIGHENLRPPVALVAYEPDRVEHALYYPLASFSPEWVAMRWAQEASIPISAIDLPATLMIAYQRMHETRESRAAGDNRLQLDPLGELARLAGYSDRERWWEATFELAESEEDIFPAVQQMIFALREAYPEATSAECALREKHMSRELLRIFKTGAQRIGLVCGAWHSSAFGHRVDESEMGDDQNERDLLARLRKTSTGYAKAKTGLKGPKLISTWIPWTYERLRLGAGYSSGIDSPVWYELLYNDNKQATAHYLTLIARELRALGAAASTAQIVDAIELAESLRSLRNLQLAGLEEIKEAARGALTQGDELRLREVMVRVESLRTSGRVPIELSSLPLQLDLEARLKELRLMKIYRDMEPIDRELDLRKPAHLAISQLLGQLILLDIPFGERLVDPRQSLGTFREVWRLHWQPDYALRLIHAHRFGHKIEDAASQALRESVRGEVDLLHLSKAITTIINAGLFGELDFLAQRIRNQAAEIGDVWLVARALPELLHLARYHSLRLHDANTLAGLNKVLLPKLAAGLPSASMGIDDEAAEVGFQHLRRLQALLGTIEDTDLLDLWIRALKAMAFGSRTHPFLAGFALRTLQDHEAIEARSTGQVMRFRLHFSAGVELRSAGHFVEGFLYSGAQVLLHQPEILRLLDEWLAALGLDDYRALLPALRRTFSQFQKHERRKLMAALTTLRRNNEGEMLQESEAEQPRRRVSALELFVGQWLSGGS